MSASDELRRIVYENIGVGENGLQWLIDITGLAVERLEFFSARHEEYCAMYLERLRGYRKDGAAKPTAAPGPRKPTPALPAESWNSRAFDPDAAHAATRALCIGSW